MRKFLLFIALMISGVGLINAQNVAKVGEVLYETLPAAVEAANDGETIYLIGDASGAGSVIDKSITIDLGGYTYSFTEGVGSGDPTSNGFQILQGNTVVLTNGTLNVAEDYKSNFYILVQNYANLTLNDINLDGTKLDKYSLADQDSYVLSNKSGEVNIVGNTNITANDEGDRACAFDVCKFDSYDAPTVNVNTTGTINGNIEVSEGYDNNLRISAGTFTMDVTQWCAEGFVCEQNEDGSYGVSEIQNGDNIIIGYEGYSLKYTVTDVDAKSCSVTCSIKPTEPTAIVIPSSVEIGKIEFSVTSIGSSAFRECSSLTSIEIPNGVTSVGNEAFIYCSDLKFIRCHAETVPSIGNNTFYYGIKNIQVPEASVEAYKEADYWKNYNITKIYPYFVGEELIVDYDEGYSLKFTVVSAEPAGCNVICSTEPTEPTAITIPATVSFGRAEVAVTSVLYGAFSECSTLTSIEIPSSITSIGSNAFESCSNLTSVTFGKDSQLTKIGSYAFRKCSSLISMEIPNTVTFIGASAFHTCPSLKFIRCYAEEVPECNDSFVFFSTDIKNVQVPENSIEDYKESDHWKNYNITKIYPYFVGEELIVDYEEGYSMKFTTLEDYGCEVVCSTKPTYPTTILIPTSAEINGMYFPVTSIGNNAFNNCSNLTDVNFSEDSKLTSIGYGAFYNCSSLTEIEIPSSVKEILANPYPNNSYYHGTFERSNLTSVTFEKNSQLTLIGDGAFSDCSSLTGIEIPNSVTSIGNYAFARCSNLTSIEIPSSVTSIGDNTFSYCSDLERIKFDENSQLTLIGDYAFDWCISLTSIEIPSSVISIGYRAFYSCSNLLKVSVEENSQLNIIGDYAFSNCLITSFIIPNRVTSIGSDAFYGCRELSAIYFGDNSQLTSIGSNAFYQCSKLTSIDFGENSKLASIGDKAFYGAFSSSAVIEIPSSVTSIGNSAFENSSAKNIEFGENSQLTSISNSAFKNCRYLDSIVLPKNVKEIRNFAFQNCTSLKFVGFEDNSQLTSISDLVFKGCNQLQKVEIPSRVDYIGYESFANCGSLIMIKNAAAEVPQTDNDAFNGCPERMRIQVPTESLEDYQEETPWKNYTLVSEIVQHEITTSVNLGNAGNTQGAGTYFDGEDVTVKATARNYNYTFAYWSENGEFVSSDAEYKFVAESDRDLQANFMNDNHWKPNPGISSHNMTVIADLQIDCVSANNINIEIGAFCGDELRGNARIQYFEVVDKFLYQIVIYGEKEDQIKFRLYDHNAQQEMEYISHDYLTFTEDATYGSIDVPSVINFSQRPKIKIEVVCNVDADCDVTGGGEYYQGDVITIRANQVEGLLFQNWTLYGEVVSSNYSYTFTVEEPQRYVANYVYAHNRHLNKGWNWYSTYMQLSGEEGLNTVQTALGSAVSQMKSQTAFDTYEQGEWIGALDEYSTEQMYMINVTKNSGYDFTLIGTPVNPSDDTLELKPNWNWVGYPVSANMSISDALANITPKHGDYFKSQTEFSQYYEGSGWLGALQTLEKGQGYMYQNTSEKTLLLVYPNDITSQNENTNRSYANNHWITEIGKYPTNMNIIAVVNNAETDYEIGAFRNGECRGSARPIYIEQLDMYMIFLTVYGEEGETITFKYYDVISEEIISMSNEAKYAVNATLGSIDDPYVLAFAPTDIDENVTDMINIYPNPVNANSEIHLGTECDNVEIYNALGVKIAEYENVNHIDGIETSGIYMIKIVEQGNVRFNRIVVK